MLTQSNISKPVSISACSSTSSEQFNSAKCSLNSILKTESIKTFSSSIKFESTSPKSDKNDRDSVSTPSSTSFNPSVNNNNLLAQSPITPIMSANSDNNSNIEAIAAVAPNSTNASQLLLGAQMPVDINSMFGNFFENSNHLLNNITENKTGPDFVEKSVSGPPSFENFCFSTQSQINGLDQTAFYQLSHLLAQQTAHQQTTISSQESSKQQLSRGNQRHDSTSSNNGLQDRKRSYPYTFQYCVLCQKNVHSSKLPCHIRQCHVGKPMFQCPACDFTSTYSKNNVKSHMVSLHGLAGDPISYMDQYAGQVEEFMKKCFPNVRGRGRPVHGRLSPANISVLNKNLNFKSTSSEEVFNQNLSPLFQNRLKHETEINQQKFQNSLQKIPFNISNPATTIPSTTAVQFNNAARFNEIYAMAMLGRKSLGEKFLPLFMNNNNNECPFQNLNSLLYIQQLNAANVKEFNKQKGKEEDEKKFSNVEINKVEQFLKGFNRKFNKISENQEKDNSKVLLSLDNIVPHRKDLNFFFKNELEPKYLPQSLKWFIINRDQLDNTVFKTFTKSSEIIEKFDLSLFELFLDKSNVFLTDDQIKTIENVREQIGLKSFEILFAVHRLDLQVLKPENVRLVMSIVPTEADIRRFLAYEQSNSITSLNDNEQFILQLSKIDRLKEKLEVMNFMGCFNKSSQEINQQLSDLREGAKILQSSSEFHTILHLLLTCGNLINGDFNCQLVEGFKPSKILEMCDFKFQTNNEETLTLLDVLVDCISNHFSFVKKICDQCKVIEASSKVQFSSIAQKLQYFENGIQLIEIELHETEFNQIISNFLMHCEMETQQLKEMYQLTKDQIVKMLQFFGEMSQIDLNDNNFFLQEFQPENFFLVINKFLIRFKNAIKSVSNSNDVE